MQTAGAKSKIRRIGKWAFVRLLYISGLLAWAKYCVRRKGIVVITFHRVLNDSDFERTCSPAGMIVRESTYKELLKYLARTCEFVDVSDAVPDDSGRKPRLAVTFDDGWADNADRAFEPLRALGIPATIFICPDRVGQTLPFWPERAASMLRSAERHSQNLRAKVVNELTGSNCASASDEILEHLKRLPTLEREGRLSKAAAVAGWDVAAEDGLDSTMSWEQIERLRDCGISFGSHTSTHEILTTIAPAEALLQLRESRAAIKAQLGSDCRTFSYPNGDWSAETRELVREAGYDLALANQSGVWSQETDPLVIPRMNICEGGLVGLRRNFSPLAFDYFVFWKAFLGKSGQGLGNKQMKEPSQPPRIDLTSSQDVLEEVAGATRH